MLVVPGIVLLKLITYDDRPEERQKEAGDRAGIIQHFFELQADLIYDYHADLFADGEPDRELPDITAIVIGREINKMCGDNQTLKQRLARIVTAHIERDQTSAFEQQMVVETKKPVKEMMGWLTGLNQGLLGP